MKEKIVVFGGTGNVGELVVTKLLNKGKSVVVLTRQEKQSPSNLDFVVGSVLDENLVEKILNPNDKIIIVLGANNSDLDIMSKGTANILFAMNKKGVKRVICLSTHGAGESWDYLPDNFKEIILADDFFSASFKDHTIQEEYVKQSRTDWTIVRPTQIVSGGDNGIFTINQLNENSQFQITNSDVAQFIVTELEEDKYIREIATITD